MCFSIIHLDYYSLTTYKYRIAGNFRGRKFSRFLGKSVQNNFCDSYFRDFKWTALWIGWSNNYCGFYFHNSVYSPQNRENKNPAKISRYTVVGGVIIIWPFECGWVIILSMHMRYFVDMIHTSCLFINSKLMCSWLGEEPHLFWTLRSKVKDNSQVVNEFMWGWVIFC